MSLLVFSASSKIAQGVVRHLYASNKFEKIVCSDLYPNYASIQRHTEFLETLDTVQSNTKITDKQLIEKSDIVREVSQSTHVLYVTHDHYQNCASKLNLLRNFAKITSEQKHLKKFIALTPVELDNWAELDAIAVVSDSEKEAFKLNDKMVLVKSDLTFGQDSTFMNRVILRLVSNKALSFNPQGGGPAPIHTLDLSKGIEILLENGVLGDQYLAQGEKRVEWNTIFQSLEKLTFKKMHANPLQKLISPLSNNLVSEAYYCRKYINLAQFVNKYHPLSHIGFTDFKTILPQLTDFDSYTQNNKIDTEKYRNKQNSFQNCLVSLVQ